MCYRSVVAQVEDTVLLQQVVIQGSATENFLAGNKVEEIDSSAISEYQTQDLGALLQGKTPIYLKGYGLGQLSTVSFRGTNASQTAVLWNGININSLTLGQTDFSLLPVSALDEVKISYGASTVENGSGSIGGAVLLNSNLKNIVNSEFSFITTYNSLKNKTYSITAKVKKKHLKSATKLYSLDWKNNFDFVNRYKVGKPTENLEGAGINQKGVTQDLSYSFKDFLVYGHLWVNNRKKEIQKPASIFSIGKDVQTDLNFKSQIGAKFYFEKSDLDVKYAFVQDELTIDFLNNNLNVAHAKTNQQVILTQYSYSPNKKIKVKSKISHSFIKADLDNYVDNRVKEHRTFANLMANANLLKSVHFTLGIQQEWVTNYVASLPSIHLGTQVIKKIGSLVFSTQLAYKTAYRLPTLNDRFWTSFSGEGNPNVKPESSQSIEGSQKITFSKRKWSMTFQSTLYRNIIDNYILWQPLDGQTWSPQNFQKVESHGAETTLNFNLQTKNLKLSVNGFYAYTRTFLLESDRQNIFQDGRQLWYVPLKKSGIGCSILFKGNTTLFAHYSYSSKRGASGSIILDPFDVLDIGFSQKIKLFKNTSTHLKVKLYNLFDEQYELYQSFVQPRRYVEVQLNINLKINNS
ncbi:MAG: TonB-dependent receptor [Cyclobacteriaceae bacterium]